MRHRVAQGPGRASARPNSPLCNGGCPHRRRGGRARPQ
ncbi:hypothetical protein STRAU_4290 [Streptomyces aurantiacus JA 4570]|uniref:Uncharacterized protein n=1 Tax=Streptomyces aurantiacus JA 4570 TaxID=1286094 RepID=S3ZHU7_9ACTN|nr:hypothetical protein STRAU_4290 [Streptomyces aurantiacus JA 4570]